MARLKSFEEARRQVGALNRLPPRVRAIAVDCIVGSADDRQVMALRADFLSRRLRAQDARYQHVYRALLADAPLPAIEVYALDGRYFVVDGHHRVAAARSLGRAYLDALVHEFPLPRAASVSAGGAGTAPARRRGRFWPQRERPCACALPSGGA